jgi:hypothetical protein
MIVKGGFVALMYWLVALSLRMTASLLFGLHHQGELHLIP